MLNCKFRIIGISSPEPWWAKNRMTVDRDYTVENGRFKDNNGRLFPLSRPIKDEAELKYYLSSFYRDRDDFFFTRASYEIKIL